MKSAVFTVAIATLLVAPALSQEGPLVGEPAPPFVAETCVNKPSIVSSRDLLGEVIVLEFWGIT